MLFLRISFFLLVFPKFIFIRGMICPGNIYLGHLFNVLFQVGGQLGQIQDSVKGGSRGGFVDSLKGTFEQK